ncbi:MAG: SMP-30/gluconolactonase/LRE family protein [Rhodobacterales bacterium]|nr:SMP-30/gluconolactonase/LRE family protein [Rhodobacterales bacterium]
MATAFEHIYPGSEPATCLGSGFAFTEGPVWDVREGCLVFSDIPADTMFRWSPDDGFSVFRRPSGKSNGMTRDREGRLIVCEHYNRRVSRTEHDGTVVAVATHYGGLRLNSPNDVVVASDGSIYFTDPPYGLNPVYGIAAVPELAFSGVYRVPPDGGEPELIVADATPNGLAFSPDESLLYVADTEANHVLVFDVNGDGSVSNGHVFAPIPGHPLAPDGMKLDREGRVYVTGAGGVWVFDPSGRRLGVIPVPELPANLAWGDDDWKTLYITARTGLYRARLGVAGVPLRAGGQQAVPV